jgi:hypothetical protein
VDARAAAHAFAAVVAVAAVVAPASAVVAVAVAVAASLSPASAAATRRRSFSSSSSSPAPPSSSALRSGDIDGNVFASLTSSLSSDRRELFASNAPAAKSGAFYTSECRGGVQRRQLTFKGVEGGD